ncbi:hypothetical protein LI90_907 [Carbonactinospora thermoautotrophica]|uniref:MucB/RseB N-terminal domain-containing protein n=2 Tax=Carbonactinospora thermoautotrophica TaxID=1469144 RepID=A0A132MN97_9ACTN|nr:sigma-E factor regulatory protein RseB domain-containing protein [Carbonactinospora thermoautotrophica]KWW99273.1 hypothetical protein LI90_907 [Carbonactinospora thermoautotrophica]
MNLAPVLGAVTVLTLCIAPAPGLGGPGLRGTNDPDAVRLLERSVEASSASAYRGVQFVTTWVGRGSRSVVVDLEHRPGTGTVVRPRGASGPRGGTSFAPPAGAAPASPGSWTATPAASLLARHYHLVLGGVGPVAGRLARVVEARRRDGTVAARLWIDQASALVLRREIFDVDGTRVRASAFVRFRLLDRAYLAHLPPPTPGDTGTRATDLAASCGAGWRCPHALGTALTLFGVRRLPGEQGPAVHLAYTDGLSTLSVFQQKGSLDTVRLAGQGFTRRSLAGTCVHVRDDGPQRVVVWSADGTVYTVITDAPEDVIRAAVAALPHRTRVDMILGRLGRGVDRVENWVLNRFQGLVG